MRREYHPIPNVRFLLNRNWRRGNAFVSKLQHTGLSRFKEMTTYSHRKAQHRSMWQHLCSYKPHILPSQDRCWRAPLAARSTPWSAKIQVLRSCSARAPSPSLLPVTGRCCCTHRTGSQGWGLHGALISGSSVQSSPDGKGAWQMEPAKCQHTNPAGGCNGSWFQILIWLPQSFRMPPERLWPAPQKLQETEFKLCADVPQKLSLSIYTNTITKQQKSSLASITPWQSHAQSLYFFPQSKHSMN